jgi:hypothetical protein
MVVHARTRIVCRKNTRHIAKVALGIYMRYENVAGVVILATSLQTVLIFESTLRVGLLGVINAYDNIPLITCQ